MSGFEAKQVTHVYRQHIEGPPEAVFPLICPVREAEWLDGWTYEMVYSASGVAEPGAVFTTGHYGSDTVWVISRHDAGEGLVEFVRVTPGLMVGHIRVALKGNGDGSTTSDITYAHTPLSEAGAAAIAQHHSEADFEAMMVAWERSLNHFLRTGELLVGGGH